MSEPDYARIVRVKLTQLDQDLILEDLDLICQYIVVRFLKTSPLVVGTHSVEEIARSLELFVGDIYSFILAFIHVVNSSSLIDGLPEA
jgi:hypothetical protein